jgi:hypothetical protein
MKNVPTRVALERVQQTCGEEYRPYLAPIDTLEMLIAKPMRHIRWPAVMNGERILIRSDQFAKMMIRMAFVETSEDAFFQQAAAATYWQKCRAGPSAAASSRCRTRIR